MLLANGFGYTEWEGIQLNGLAGGHVYMNNIYNKGVLTNQDTDPVAARYQSRADRTARAGKDARAC